MFLSARVLVFPCGSEIGLELHRSLAWCKHVDLIGASSVSSNHGKYVYADYIEDIPFVDNPDFIPRLNEVIEEYQIDFIYPAHDSVVLKLARHQAELVGEIIGSPFETCKICRSKSLTYETFRTLIRVPRVYQNSDSISEFPVFLKPDVGQGSKGTHLAHSTHDVGFYLKKDPDLLILEHLPGQEFTVDCFTDRHGNLRFVGGRRRIRIQNGISVSARKAGAEIRPSIQELAAAINETLTLRGAWFFQVKEAEDGRLALMEIAPRIAGTMGFYRNIGVNFALLSVYDRLDMEVGILCNPYSLELDRALISRFRLDGLDYQSVYVDLDDTLVVDGKLNTRLLAFLYQCLNKGNKVYLISRHRGDLKQTLREYRLQNLFDEIFHVGESEEKVDYITDHSSIFIDDSYAEREQVLKMLDIPVFDLDAVESLLDWKL